MTQDELRYATKRNCINPIIYYDEIWKRIDLFDLPPIYWISNYGRVYNENTGYVMNGHIVDNGYVVVSFKNIYGRRIYKHVHRTLMLVFCPIANPELYVVNHKDGVKTNNHISNLEWVSQKYNIEHAFKIGLRKCGEKSSHSIFTDDQVNEVCKCMQDGMNIYQLSHKVFGVDPNSKIISLCSNIYSNKFWKDISCNYDISNYKKNMIFSYPQLEFICSILNRDVNSSTESILNEIGIHSYTKDEFDKYNRVIYGIKKGTKFRNISDKYNLQYIR